MAYKYNNGTLIHQHGLMLEAISQKHEDVMRLIRNRTVLMVSNTFYSEL